MALPLRHSYILCFPRVQQLAFGCAPSATPSPLLVRVCEGRSQVISCPVTKRINIQYANYGRLTGGHICPGPIGTIRCQATGSLTKVRDDCQGRAMCQLVSNNSKFGDPCYGTYKYLEVRTFGQALFHTKRSLRKHGSWDVRKATLIYQHTVFDFHLLIINLQKVSQNFSHFSQSTFFSSFFKTF